MEEIAINCSSNYFALCDYNSVYEALKTIVFHILFVRELLPMPIGELRKLAEPSHTETKIGKSAKNDRLLRSFLSQVDSALDSISCVNSEDFKSIALILGPSVNNPKETYIMNFSSASSTSEITDLDDQEKILGKFRRHIIHKLIESSPNQDFPPPQKTNIYVAMKLKSESPNEDTELVVGELFAIRDSLKIKSRARGPKPIQIRFTTSEIDANGAENDASSSSWIVLKKGIKTLPKSWKIP